MKKKIDSNYNNNNNNNLSTNPGLMTTLVLNKIFSHESSALETGCTSSFKTELFLWLLIEGFLFSSGTNVQFQNHLFLKQNYHQNVIFLHVWNPTLFQKKEKGFICLQASVAFTNHYNIQHAALNSFFCKYNTKASC